MESGSQGPLLGIQVAAAVIMGARVAPPGLVAERTTCISMFTAFPIGSLFSIGASLVVIAVLYAYRPRR